MPFLSFSCLISVARISSTVLNKSNRGDIFDLLLILKEKLSAFTIEYDGSGGFFVYVLYCVDVCPRGGGAWWAALYGVAQSRTQLK